MLFSLSVRRHSIVTALFFLFLFWAHRPVQAQTFSANNPAIYYSPWNWNVSPTGTAVTNEPGAYFQFTFSGSQNVTLNLDLTGIATLNSANYMFVHITIDGVLYPDVPITYEDPTKNPNRNKSLTQMLLASNLKPGKHTLRLWLSADSVNFDRWGTLAVLADNSQAPAESLRITGITLDPGATLLPNTNLQPRSIVFYGDSITEGYAISPFHNATLAYPFTCAQQLHAEFGVIGNSGQGWTINNAPSTGVPFFPYAWNYHYLNAPRFSPSSPAAPADYILVNMGANDGLCSDAANPVRHSGTATYGVNFLEGIRAANPKSRIFLVVPFGNFYAQAVQNAVAQYQQTHPLDHGVFLIDLGWSAWTGITGGGVPTANSYDGTHPNVATSQAIGFQLAAAVQTALGQYDFLGTGRSDLILQNNVTGHIAFQSPLDTAIGAKSYVSPVLPSGYQVVGAGDFNGDGEPDLVLQNRATGVIAVWYMNGTTVIGSGTVALKAPTGWQVVGVADIDNDGNPDLVLQNSATSQVVVWYMNGVAVNSVANLSATPVAGYQVVGVTDFNRDGKPDLLLQNPASNQLVVWYLNGVEVSGHAVIPMAVPAGYRVQSVADYFGDGRADLVLRNSSGALLIWRPAETGCLVGTFSTPSVDPAWSIVGPH